MFWKAELRANFAHGRKSDQISDVQQHKQGKKENREKGGKIGDVQQKKGPGADETSKSHRTFLV